MKKHLKIIRYMSFMCLFTNIAFADSVTSSLAGTYIHWQNSPGFPVKISLDSSSYLKWSNYSCIISPQDGTYSVGPNNTIIFKLNVNNNEMLLAKGTYSPSQKTITIYSYNSAATKDICPNFKDNDPRVLGVYTLRSYTSE